MSFTKLKYETGLTLVELMVALVLGLFLTGLVATIYLGSKQSYSMSTQIARSQEGTRFTTNFLKKDLRMAAYTECSRQTRVNSLLKTPMVDEAGIFGWEYDGTGASNTAFNLTYQDIDPSGDIAAARTSNTGAASKWVSSAGVLPATLHDLEPLTGSDILLVKREEQLNLEIVPITNATNRTFNTSSIIQGQVDRGTIVKIGNCNLQDKFQNQVPSNNINARLRALENLTGGNYLPGNVDDTAFSWSAAWSASDRLYKEVTTIYYVGTGASGIPSLFRLVSDCGLSPDCRGRSAASEVVEGVESMQVLYGEDTDTTPDGVANIYRSADGVGDFNNVVSVKLGLLIRSPDNTKQEVDTNNYVLADSVTIDVPNDRYLRYVTNNTVHLRNTGL